MATPWIIGILLAIAYFAYFEWRAFAYPEKQVTLSRFVWTIGRGWPLAIFLMGMLCGGLAVHFFWNWCPDLGSINGMLISPAKADELILPDPKLTPGVARDDITQDNICRTKWGKDRRFVTATMKREVFASYGIKCRPLWKGANLPACGKWEVDHCISRELGGADDVKNLWPEFYSGPWNAHDKDRVENRLHKELCAGNITLKQAQDDICANDWRDAYRRYFGDPND